MVRKVSNMIGLENFLRAKKLNLIRLFSVRFWRNSMKNNRLSAGRGIFCLVENRLYKRCHDQPPPTTHHHPPLMIFYKHFFIRTTFFRLSGIRSNHSFALYIIASSNEEDHLVQVQNDFTVQFF